MVHAMAKDRGRLPRVAWVFVVVGHGCGPTVRPDMPFPEEAVVRKERAPAKAPPGRQVVVGEMCPRGADGRTAVAPLLVRTAQWSDTAAEVTGAVERGETPRFAVFGTAGRVPGLFGTVGFAYISLGHGVPAEPHAGPSPGRAD